jgi:hypothetical protein
MVMVSNTDPIQFSFRAGHNVPREIFLNGGATVHSSGSIFSSVKLTEVS